MSSLLDLAEQFLRDSPAWTEIAGVPHLKWLDEHAAEMGDRRALSFADAVQREILYELRDRSS